MFISIVHIILLIKQIVIHSCSRSTPPGLMAPGEEDLDDDYDEEEAEGLLASLVLARPHLEQGQGR